MRDTNIVEMMSTLACLALYLSLNGSFAQNGDVIEFHFDDREPSDVKLKKAKYVDIFANHPHVEDVRDGYYRQYESKIPRNFVRYEPVEIDRRDTINFPNMHDIFSFSERQHHLESEFGQIESGDTRRPFWHDQDRNEATTKFSYVQKIKKSEPKSSPTTTHLPNRYEEIPIITNPKTLNNKHKPSLNATKKSLTDILKHYLAKLYKTKYKLSNAHLSSNRTDGAIDRPKIPKSETESKFLSSETLSYLKNKTLAKINKLFSIFTVIKFNNTECNATNFYGTWQGVCYTDGECLQMGGTSFGNCANGYGVCCVFRGSCGDWSATNCSYFKSPNYPDYYPSDGGVIVPTTTPATTTVSNTPDPRLHWYYYSKGLDDPDELTSRQNSDTTSCTFSVYKTNPNVRQMRIDFVDLDLSSPTNGTCVMERLVITGQNANNQIPVICGYNTGQHVYVDVSELNGPLQIMVLSTTGSRKRFKLRICQYEDDCNSPTSNCLQYYTGVTGVIQSLNYDQAVMFNRSTPGYFNNLNYAICIRREAGYCSIMYTNVQNGVTYPFQLVNVDDTGDLTIPSGQAGVDILNCPDDYVVMDGTRLCGERFNDGSTDADFTMNAAVTDTSAGPIVVAVRSNADVTGLGFKLFYTQNSCT